MKRLLGLVVASALLFVGAGCTPQAARPPVAVTSTYGKMFEAWFEGWDRTYLTFSYPSHAFVLSEKNDTITFTERGGSRVHKISASYEGGRGWSPTDYWKETNPCPACKLKPSSVVIKGVSNILDYASTNKEFIVFPYAAWLIVVEFDRPTDADRAIVSSFVLADAKQDPEKFSFVKIGLIAIGAHGEKIGCNDRVVLHEVPVPKTDQVLNAAMRALFTAGYEPDPSTGDISVIPETTLTFDRAIIDQGFAKIYLMGSAARLVGCSALRLPAQIRATAMQFSSVKNVEIYIGGVKQP